MADVILPMWYPAENNWKQCMEEMHHKQRKIQLGFSGQMDVEKRAREATAQEKFSEMLNHETGGRVGQEAEKFRNAKVWDIFQDFDFPPEEGSWYRGGERSHFSELVPVTRWRRLQELSMDAIPYPMPTPQNGNFTPRSGRVYQGALEDFYLVQGMQAVGMRPQLVDNLFANMGFSNARLGAFILRFHKHGQWHPVEVDDALPFDADGNPLCSRSEYFPSFSWPCLIEKAYAKLHGSWEALGGGGHVEEVMADLTGGCATRFGTKDVAADRLWAYLYFMLDYTIFACNMNESEFGRRNVPHEGLWAASIYRVARVQDVPYVQVCMAAPTVTMKHLPFCDLPPTASPEGYGVHDGYAWLRIEDFVSFFDTIYECRLFNSDLGPLEISGLPYTPAWAHGSPWFEEMWAYQGTVDSETAPAFLLDTADAPIEITFEATQTDLRYPGLPNGRLVDMDELETSRPIHAPLLLRFYQCSKEVNEAQGGEIYLVHLSAWGHCRDAVCGVKVMRPGRFLAMVSIPAGYSCNRMIFRAYATRPIHMRPITKHRHFVMVNPAMPLDAIPYHLAGFMKMDGPRSAD